jgi:hypothetical protein
VTNAREDLKESEVIMPDGSFAKFFSSVRPNIVLKHFEWMAKYGITGVFHHCFMLGLGNAVLAAGPKVENLLCLCWMSLVDVKRVTESSNYILQNGLPVLHIWGIGFEHINVTVKHS